MWRLAAAVAACGLWAWPAVAPASAEEVGLRVAPADALAAQQYWTPARMRAARPAGPVAETPGAGERAVVPSGRAGFGSRTSARRATAVDVSGNPTAFPDRVHGKVFFTVAGGSDPGDFVCSATVARSRSHTLVWTAGHCVNDAQFGGGFAINWVFVPGYRDGQRPFGSWPARRLFTTVGWQRHENVRVDLGAARLARDAEGRGIQDVIGARRLAFGLGREQRFTAFGYPALPALLHPEFNGERLYACGSPTTGSDHPPGAGPTPLQIHCDMTGGASGGGWVNASGRLASVTSYGYLTDPNHLYGPYQGEEAKTLYRAARGPRERCAGKAVTNLGRSGADDFTGTGGPDVFKLRGGNDRARGRGGRDRACGGPARDRLLGGRGEDRLRGGPSNDVLVGGSGFDRCNGGPGRDRARGCERRISIP